MGYREHSRQSLLAELANQCSQAQPSQYQPVHGAAARRTTGATNAVIATTIFTTAIVGHDSKRQGDAGFVIQLQSRTLGAGYCRASLCLHP